MEVVFYDFTKGNDGLERHIKIWRVKPVGIEKAYLKKVNAKRMRLYWKRYKSHTCYIRLSCSSATQPSTVLGYLWFFHCRVGTGGSSGGGHGLTGQRQTAVSSRCAAQAAAWWF